MIKFKKIHKNARFDFGSEGAAGHDLATVEDISVVGDGVIMANTGIIVQIPVGYVGLLIPRSSLHKRGWKLANSMGVIDSDYRGEILVALKTTKGVPDILRAGDRIVQLVVVPVMVGAEMVDDLDNTKRGENGFGSSGL
jgi:dUTP pyrophosphatase